MNIILLGPPGAGKGTVAAELKEHYQLPHISTGDLFRFHIKNETELGKRVKKIIDSGDLVPDEITTEMLKLRLKDDDTKSGTILGSPSYMSPEQLTVLPSCRGVRGAGVNRLLKQLSGARFVTRVERRHPL